MHPYASDITRVLTAIRISELAARYPLSPRPDWADEVTAKYGITVPGGNPLRESRHVAVAPQPQITAEITPVTEHAARFFRRLAAAGCGKAELGDREEELATVAEFALLIGPGLSLFLAHPALLGYVLLEQGDERAAVGIGDQLGRREGVGVHLDVIEARVA